MLLPLPLGEVASRSDDGEGAARLMGAAPHPALRATFPRRVKASAAVGNFAVVLLALPLGELSPKVTERAHAVSPVAKVSSATRNFPAMLKGSPLGELAR